MTTPRPAGKETRAAWSDLGEAAPLLLLVLSWSWVLPWQATAGAVGFAALPHLGLHLSGLLAAVVVGRRLRGVGLLVGALFLVSFAWDAFAHAAAGPPDPFLSPPHLLAALGTAVVLIHRGSAQARPRAEPRPGFPGRGGGEWPARGSAPAGEAPGAAPEGVAPALERGAVLLGISLLATEYLGRPNLWHAPGFYVAAGALFPVWLVAWSRSSRGRTAATAASLAHLLLWGMGVGSLALLAPVLPGLVGAGAGGLVLPALPVVLVPAAVGIDLVLGGRGREGPRAPAGEALRALVSGPLFLLLLVGAHWHAAELLLGAGLGSADGAEVGVGGWTSTDAGYWVVATGRRAFATGMAGAALAAALSSGAGWLLSSVVGRRGTVAAGENAGGPAAGATS